MGERELVEERLLAYIRPNEAATSDQEAALAEAVEAQLAWEKRIDAEGLPPGVDSLTVGSYSIKRGDAGGAACARGDICPAAWAILRNAGLLRRALPQAQRI